MATGSSSGVSGFGSSFDWRSFVSQMVAVERQPQQRVRAEQSSLNQKRDAIGSLVTALGSLQEKAKSVSNPDLFNARAVSLNNSINGLATATAADKALIGGFSIEVLDSSDGIAATGPWRGASIRGDSLLASGKPATLSTKLSQLDNPPSSNSGSITINGKSITLSSSSTLADVITSINGAGAGISARFDTATNRISVTSTISSDGSKEGVLNITGSEYATALGLADKDPIDGVPIRFRIDGGDLQSSDSRVLTEDKTGLVGLTITVAPGKLGTIDLVSSQDTSKIRGAITDFVDAYNKVQSLISTQTAVTPSSDGKVTAGVLAFDPTVGEAASKLRRMFTATQASAPSDLKRLDLLGFTSGNQNNQITLTDGERLDMTLKSNPDSVKAFFATAKTGLANLVTEYAAKLSDSASGSLVNLQTSLKNRASDLDTQLAAMERQVQLTQDRLTASFISMERVQAKLNQQLQYLQQRFQ